MKPFLPCVPLPVGGHCVYRTHCMITSIWPSLTSCLDRCRCLAQSYIRVSSAPKLPCAWSAKTEKPSIDIFNMIQERSLLSSAPWRTTLQIPPLTVMARKSADKHRLELPDALLTRIPKTHIGPMIVLLGISIPYRRQDDSKASDIHDH